MPRRKRDSMKQKKDCSIYKAKLYVPVATYPQFCKGVSGFSWLLLLRLQVGLQKVVSSGKPYDIVSENYRTVRGTPTLLVCLILPWSSSGAGDQAYLLCGPDLISDVWNCGLRVKRSYICAL